MMGMPLRSAGRTSFRALFLAISAGCLACLGSGNAPAEVISAQLINDPPTPPSVPAVPFSGVEPDAVAANSQFANSNVWNQLGAPNPFDGPVSFSNLVDSTGAPSGASFDLSHVSGAFNDISGGKFPNIGFYTTESPVDFTISGLAPNEDFTLFLYSVYTTPNGLTHDAVFTVPGDTFDIANGTPSSEQPGVMTGSLTGMTSATGTITGTWAFGPTFDPAVGGDVHWAGFQLATGAPSSVPEPGSLALLAGALALVGVLCTRRSYRTNKAG